MILTSRLPHAQGGFLEHTRGAETRGPAHCRSSRPLLCRAEKVHASLRGPDLALTFDGVPVHIFGVQHTEPQPYIGEYILQQQPHSVVVETAITPGHGLASGNPFSCSDYQSQQSSFFARLFCQISGQLSQEPIPAATRTWQDLQKQFVGEQLVYIAALAVGAPLIYGDRPKSDTYLRLSTVPRITDLDRAFGLQSALNYEEMVSGRPAVAPFSARTCVEHILLTERDACLCRSLAQAAGSHPQGFRRPLVVGAVGEAHLEGIARMWDGRGWLQVLAQADAGSKSESDQERDGESSPEAEGVKRALLESVLRLSCRDSVTSDLGSVLGPVHPSKLPSYQIAHELYGGTRMLLACLSKEHLAEVCSGWRCDMWEVLSPVRNARPVNGGTACDLDLVLELRTLHFELPS